MSAAETCKLSPSGPQMSCTEARPRVLVLLATYNGSRWLRDQLVSILSQRDVDVEIAARDDASIDDTVVILKKTLEATARWTLAVNATRSGSAAANFFESIFAADVTGHDYIAFSDQDDLWDSGKLARATSKLRSDNADGYSAAVEGMWPDGRRAVLTQSTKIRSADYVFEGGGQGCSFVLTRSCFERCREVLAAHRAVLANMHYHDWVIYAVCRVLGGRWYFDAIPCLEYRQHTANDTGARTGAAGRKKRIALIKSRWYGEQVAQIARLCAAINGVASAGAKRYLAIKDIHSPALRRLSLVGFVLLHGRRRLPDRLVLAAAALLGYL